MMHFHKNINITLLFDVWKIDSTKEFILATFIIAVLTIVYEFCSSFTKYLNYSLHIKEERLSLEQRIQLNTRYKRIRRHAMSGVCYVITLIFSYVIMLLVMTFQIYILLTVLIGSSIGYFFFNPIILRGMDRLYLNEISKIKTLMENNSECISL